MGIILGLSAALFWGTADFLVRYTTRIIGTYRTLLRFLSENICTHSFPTAFVVPVSSVGASRPKPFWSYPASAGKFTSLSEPIPLTT